MEEVAREVRELALLYSIQPAYRDMNGKKTRASEPALLATLKALGAPIENRQDVAEALRRRRLELCRRVVEPVTTHWGTGPLRLRLTVPADAADAPIHLHLRLEDGTEHSLSPDAIRDISTYRVEQTEYRRRIADIPLGILPSGYHELTLSWNGQTHRTLLLAAPERAWEQPGRKMWGVFAPVYGLRSERDWGVGDLTDLSRLIRNVGDFGGAGIATLPLQAVFLSEPFEPSPYSPVSRLFFNELYLDPERIPEFDTSEEARSLVASHEFQQQSAELRQSELVDYRKVASLKRRVVEMLAESFFERGSPERRSEFEAFLGENPRVESYARFRAVVESGKWPERPPEGSLLQLDASDEPARRYHLYAQWQIHRQLESVAGLARSNGFGLYLDFPLGVHGGGFDAWDQRELFAMDASAGAPPDSLFTGGQNWGFPPLHPERLRETGYRYLIESLRASMRFAGVLRFDHVMALHRLYWIPPGIPATEGVYVRYNIEEHLAILAIESHRFRTIIVGEDLGTVPAIIQHRMKRHGLHRMYVLQYEIWPGNQVREAPAASVASLNTHDMPPFAGYWKGIDLEERHRLGQMPELERERQQRERTTDAFASFVGKRSEQETNQGDPASVYDAAMEYLARGPAELVLANAEDLWLAVDAQNLPGTHLEHPNWRRKLARRVDELTADPELAARLRQFEIWRRQGRRDD
ncbi:MAG: 4-alpha-glucanotransferase [Thermoanaerobaculia bacterium]